MRFRTARNVISTRDLKLVTIAPTRLGRIRRERDQRDENARARKGEGKGTEMFRSQICNVKEGRSERTPSADAFGCRRFINAGGIDP